jgi:hypothetical protein
MHTKLYILQKILFPSPPPPSNTRTVGDYLLSPYQITVSSPCTVFRPSRQIPPPSASSFRNLPFLLVAAPVGLTPNPERCGPMIASTTKREQPCTGNEQPTTEGKWWEKPKKGGRGSSQRNNVSLSCILYTPLHRLAPADELLISFLFWLGQPLGDNVNVNVPDTAGSKRVGGDDMHLDSFLALCIKKIFVLDSPLMSRVEYACGRR